MRYGVDTDNIGVCSVAFQRNTFGMGTPVFDFCKNKVIKKIVGLEQYSEAVYVIFTDNFVLKFYHEQDCCEDVLLEDFDLGMIDDAAKLPQVIGIEESESDQEIDHGHQTWTFYRIHTSQGDIWMRWMGESNGYYSEDVDVKLGVVYEWH